MSVTGEIKNLYSDKDKTRVLLPRTKTKAVSDENGTSLDVLLNDINVSIKKAAPINLLDNSDFTNPVNQRGLTRATGDYFIDRWLGLYTTVTPEGLVFDNPPAKGNAYIIQRLDLRLVSRLEGKRVTIAANIDNELKIYSFVFSSTGVGCNSDGLLYQAAAGTVEIGIARDIGGTVKWMALYEGEYTIDTLPEYHPKGYGVELAECQRYYYRIDNNNEPCWLIAVDSSFAVGAINFPVTMRLDPSLTNLKCLDLHSNEVSIYNTVRTRKGISYLYGSFQAGAGYRLLFEASADL